MNGPEVCVGAVAVDNDQLLLIRRGRGPAQGEWSVPGGRVKAGETLAEAVVRELLEETGVAYFCDASGRPVDAAHGDFAAIVERARLALVTKRATFPALLAELDWYCDLRPLRYLSHFITPKTSPIRFSARFFLCPVPEGQAPRLITEETSEGFWIHPGEGHRRFRSGEMAMAEPAEYGLAYLAQFDSLADLWAAHDDRRHKMHGIVDRIEFWAEFDWKEVTWRKPRPQ